MTRGSLVGWILLTPLLGAALSALWLPLSGSTLALFALCSLAAGIGGGVLWRRHRGGGAGVALLAACVPLCAYWVVATAAVTASGSDRSWDTARLTPSIAWVRGHEVYATATEGAVQSTMYPPFQVVAYAPAALGGTPVEALRIGAALTLLFSFVPVLLLLARASSDTTLCLVGFAAFVFASRLVGSLAYSLFQVHADAPALGLAAAACAVSLRQAERPAAWQLPLVAVLAWLSVWSKQVMVPILVALPLWLLVVRGRADTLRLLSWLVLAGGLLAALLLSLFPPAGVLFNVYTIPAAVPWRFDGQLPRLVQLLDVLVDLLVHALPLLLLFAIGVGMLVWAEGGSEQPRTLRERLRASPWALPAWLAAALAPVSLLGRAKVGGDLNTLSPTTYFLLAACVMVYLEIPSLLPTGSPRSERLRQLALGSLAGACLGLGALAAGEALRQAARTGHISEHPTEHAYVHLVTRDPDAFFPTHPLAHLLADGSLYHLAQALHDREHLAKLPLPSEQRLAHLPRAPSMVCWDWSWGVSWVASHYLREYAVSADPPDLDDHFECYVRRSADRSGQPHP